MDAALVFLTAALVLTTAIYAFFTWRMADEMKKTRFQTVRPKLGLYIHPYSPLGGHVGIRSLGPGVALNVNLKLTFQPSGESRTWQTPLFSPGEDAQFFFPNIANKLPGFVELRENQVQVNIEGSMLDVSGRAHPVDEHLNAGAWSEALGYENQVYAEPPLTKIARELEKIREDLKAG